MKEPAQQCSETIEKLQTRIQILMDENRLLKERLDEAGVSYADIVEEMPELYDLKNLTDLQNQTGESVRFFFLP